METSRSSFHHRRDCRWPLPEEADPAGLDEGMLLADRWIDDADDGHHQLIYDVALTWSAIAADLDVLQIETRETNVLIATADDDHHQEVGNHHHVDQAQRASVYWLKSKASSTYTFLQKRHT